VTPGDLTLYACRVRAVLARDEPATAELHALLAAARGRAVGQLAFETALQIQAEAAALDWLVAPQRVTGCSPGLVVAARADGVEFSLAASGDRLDRWTTGRTGATDTKASDSTPAQWRSFATRNAELAAALASG
jgi:excinuclease ABC subunit C